MVRFRSLKVIEILIRKEIQMIENPPLDIHSREDMELCLGEIRSI
jgi:hypothetical protein